MKKGWVWLVALALLCVAGCAGAETTTTVLMYMCGTDLQSACVSDLYEMCDASYSDDVNIVVQAGGASEWDDDNLTPYALNRFTVSYGDFSDMEVLDNQSMGDQQTLMDFLDWGTSSYPADRYVLVFWDHGGGSAAGVCFDETADNDSLTLHEINDALYEFYQSNPDFPLDIVGFDACLMATYENAAHLRHYANYMVASEELEPGIGWYYTGWLSKLCDDPDMDSQSLAVAIADAYMEACTDENPDDYLSMSVVYLPAMNYLVDTMETYAAYLSQALNEGQLAAFSRARQRMYAFGEFSDASSDMVDMAAMLQATRSIAPQTAAALESAYQKAVRYNVGTEKFDYLTGLSIYFPSDDYDGDAYDCGENIPNYSDFVRGYATLRSGGNYVFTAQAPAQLTTANANTVFTGELTASSFFPGVSYVADEDDVPEDVADVTAGLPDVTTSMTAANTVCVGSIFPALDASGTGGLWDGMTDFGTSSDSDAVYACAMELTEDELNNLSMVEGLLYMDASDDEDTIYIEMGAMQNAGINWETGEIVSNFDGTWPMLDEQLVVLYDQLVNGGMRRSLIPVKRNGVAGYLLVTRKTADGAWSIVGFSEGYDENGLPVRGSVPLAEGDEIIPTYPMYYEDEDGELQEAEFDGDPIYAGANGSIDFGFYSLEGGETTYLYCFRLTDIYGECQLSEFIEFEL